MAGASNQHVLLAGSCHPFLNDHYLQRSQLESDDSASCFYLQLVFANLNIFALLSLLRLQSKAITSNHHVSPVESSRLFLFSQFFLQNISFTAKSKCYFDWQEEFSHLGPSTHLNQQRLHLEAKVFSHHVSLAEFFHQSLFDQLNTSFCVENRSYPDQPLESCRQFLFVHLSLHRQHSRAQALKGHVWLEEFSLHSGLPRQQLPTHIAKRRLVSPKESSNLSLCDHDRNGLLQQDSVAQTKLQLA